ICKGVNNSKVDTYMSRKYYYAAASFCFGEKSKNPIYRPNISKEELLNKINSLYNDVTNYRCFENYQCEEIKYQVLSRLKDANSSINNIQYSYWRYYSALGWYKLLEISKSINRVDTCDTIDSHYKLLQYTYQYELPTNLSCFQKRDYLSEIFFMFLDNDTNYMNMDTVRSIEQLNYYYYSKYGFSITSYNDLELGKALVESNSTLEGFYYLLLSIQYAI
ncbi:MAG: hypothetical protein ACPLX8_00485, partial [Nanopusillaceae archaeon]